MQTAESLRRTRDETLSAVEAEMFFICCCTEKNRPQSSPVGGGASCITWSLSFFWRYYPLARVSEPFPWSSLGVSTTFFPSWLSHICSCDTFGVSGVILQRRRQDVHSSKATVRRGDADNTQHHRERDVSPSTSAAQLKFIGNVHVKVESCWFLWWAFVVKNLFYFVSRFQKKKAW